MLNDIQSQELINKLLVLRENSNKSKDSMKEYLRFEEKCTREYSYIISMRCSRYKEFNNYEDLLQEGYVALTKAIKTYNPKKGSFFFWAHKYIDTRIARCASQHTTIRYPLKVAKENVPKREYISLDSLEEDIVIDRNFEQMEAKKALNKGFAHLNEQQAKVMNILNGLNGEKEASVSICCKTLQISRAHCLKVIEESFAIIKQNI